MADYRRGSRYIDGKESEFRGSTTIFPKEINYSQLEYATFITISARTEFRPDLLSLEAYNRVDLGWIIMASNKIDNVSGLIVNTTLGIPEIQGII